MDPTITNQVIEWHTIERVRHKTLFGWQVVERPAVVTRHLVTVHVKVTAAEKGQAEKPHIGSIVLDTEEFDLSPLDHEINLTTDKQLQAILISQKRWLTHLQIKYTLRDFFHLKRVFKTYPQASHYVQELKKNILPRMKHYLSKHVEVEKVRL